MNNRPLVCHFCKLKITDMTNMVILTKRAYPYHPICAEKFRADCAEEANEQYRGSLHSDIKNLQKIIAGYEWLSEPGRGSYEYDDETYQFEFGNALSEIKKAIAPIDKFCTDLKNCPTDSISINYIRTKWQSLAQTLAIRNAELEVLAYQNRNIQKDENPCSEVANDHQKIWYHGTSFKNMQDIIKTGFKVDTCFARNMQDAAVFGGPYVFSVEVQFSSAVQLGWQIYSPHSIPASAINNIFYIETL